MFAIRHVFYNSIKEIVYRRQAGKQLKQRTSPITVFYSLRGVFILFTMLTNYENTLWQYDYLICFAHSNPKLYDSLLATAIIFVGIFAQKAKAGFVDSPVKIWQYFYDLIVLNTDYYRQCFKSPKEVALIRRQRAAHLEMQIEKHMWVTLLPKRLQKYFCSISSRLAMWKNLEAVDLPRMQDYTIRIYRSEAPLELRIKLILAVDVIDKVCFGIQIFIYCLYVLFVLTYGPLFIRLAPEWYHLLLILIDLVGIFYAFPLLIRCACIYSLCSFTGNLVYAFKFKQCELLLKNAMHQWSAGHRSAHYTTIKCHFEHFLAEHTLICAHVLYGNCKLWSRMMFYFLATNIPANVYFSSHLIFDSLPLLEKLIYSVLFSTQMIAAIFVLLRLAKNSKLIHSFARYIPAIQQMMYGLRFRLLKLKFDHLLYRLTATKYGMSVGPVFLVTYHSIFEVCTVYIYYLLFAFRFKMNIV